MSKDQGWIEGGAKPLEAYYIPEYGRCEVFRVPVYLSMYSFDECGWFSSTSPMPNRFVRFCHWFILGIRWKKQNEH